MSGLFLTLRHALGTNVAPVRHIRVQAVTVRIVGVRAGIVRRLLQPHQHVQERIPLVLCLGGLSRFQPDVFRRYSGQSLGWGSGPGIGVQDELGGVSPRRPSAVQLEAFAGRFSQVGGQGVVPDVGEPGSGGVQFEGAT